MITASKMISFNDGVAESLTIRVGEKNRQFKFSPDIDITDYDVKMVIIKPDNTFTITDCSVDDGFIIAAIPEQAAAVPGLGGYNIRVYDDDTNIYSAAGGVWVDDSLLLDELIESVAEVNGYIFPDDFFTTGDIEANPSGAATDALDKIRIFETIYSIEGTEPEFSLDDLTDVTITDPENGEVLTRSGDRWINAALPYIPPDLSIEDLTDVTITDPENGEVLTRSGNRWINAELPYIPPVSKVASGNPVEFDDGADAPLIKCVTEIQGYQEGTGTPSPENIRPIVAYTEGEIEVSDGDGNVTTHTTTYPSAIYRGSEDCVKGSVVKSWGVVTYSDATGFVEHSSGRFYHAGLPTGADTTREDAISNCGVFSQTSTNYGGFAFGSSGVYINKAYAGEDLTAFNMRLQTTPYVIAYALATPTTSSVTPTNIPVKSLSGYTHIESSTGEMEVEYITQHYEPIIKAAEILAQS